MFGRGLAFSTPPKISLVLLLLWLDPACGAPDADVVGNAPDVTATAPDTEMNGATDGGNVATDGNAADVATTDGNSSEIAPNEVSVDAGNLSCPGGPSCPCNKNDACDNGICLDTANGKKCAVVCAGETGCAQGSTCKPFGGNDSIFVCVSNYVTLCSPCQTAADCIFNNVVAACLDYGTQGKFCGGACNQDGDCPSDYACATIQDGGKQVQQCKRKADASGVIACSCSLWGTASGHSTTCQITNDKGSCDGKRTCEASGLGACVGKTPTEEICNALDDNCDGKVDNLPLTAKCTIKAYNAGSGIACLTDSDCKVKGESCDNNACKILLGACPGTPSCASNGAFLCLGAPMPKAEVCNGSDDDCDGLIDEDFGVTGLDGVKAGVGDACGTGVCAGGSVQCATLAQAVCSTESKAKTEVCDGNDNDCDGKIDNSACDDKDACTADTCDAVAAACSHTPSVDCDDKNQCTTDTCAAKSGECTHATYVGSCSDGDACTTGDACAENPDKSSICVAGKAVDCDDKNLCTDDSCDAKTGCVHAANAATDPCYDGAIGSKGVGSCKGGLKSCVDSQLGVCVGQIVPSLQEECDGVDDNCNGFVDEGCKPGALQGDFVAAAGGTGGAWLELASGNPTGVSQAPGGKAGWWGFLYWIVSVFQ